MEISTAFRVLRASYRPAMRLIEPRTCAAPGCTHETSDRKPYCVEHLDRLPYVRKIRAALRRREREDAIAASRAVALDPGSDRVREILETVEAHGTIPVARLGRLIEADKRALHGYLEVLTRAGCVDVLALRKKRGKIRRFVALKRSA